MYIVVNNQTVYYQKLGRGKPLILLHGWGQDVSTWWGVTDQLKENFTLYLVDLPGFGRSELPKSPFKVKDYVDLVSEFIRKQKIKNPILLGHSLGGRIAIKLAFINPDLISQLILEDSAGLKPEKGLKQIIAYPLAKIAKYLLPNVFNLKDKLKISVYKSLESDYLNAGMNRETLLNLLNEDLTEDLIKIKTETLIIWGEKDRAVPLNDAKKMYKLIENSRLEVIDEVGHFPHLENPQKFIYWIKNFGL